MIAAHRHALQVWGVLQEPTCEGLDEYVLSHFERMEAALVEGIQGLDPSRLHELRHDDLARDPLSHVEALYDRFECDGFERGRTPLRSFLEPLGPYEEHSCTLPAETVDAITRRRGAPITRWGCPLR